AGKVRIGACGEVETAGSSFPALHLRDADVDSALAGVWIPGCVDPANPFPARHRRDVSPQVLDPLRSSCQGGLEVLRQTRLWPALGWLELERRRVTGADPSGALELAIDLHPMAASAVRLQHGLEAVTV